MADILRGLEDAANGLKNALLVEMDACDAKPCTIFVSPSPVTPIQDCCDCEDGNGTAWVALVRASTISDRNAGYSPCGSEVEAMFVLGIARCAYTIDDHGNAPSVEELEENAATQFRDYGIMRRAVLDRFAPAFDLDKQMFRFGDFDPRPVRGGCMPYTLEVFVRLECLGGC